MTVTRAIVASVKVEQPVTAMMSALLPSEDETVATDNGLASRRAGAHRGSVGCRVGGDPVEQRRSGR